MRSGCLRPPTLPSSSGISRTSGERSISSSTILRSWSSRRGAWGSGETQTSGRGRTSHTRRSDRSPYDEGGSELREIPDLLEAPEQFECFVRPRLAQEPLRELPELLLHFSVRERIPGMPLWKDDLFLERPPGLRSHRNPVRDPLPRVEGSEPLVLPDGYLL